MNMYANPNIIIIVYSHQVYNRLYRDNVITHKTMTNKSQNKKNKKYRAVTQFLNSNYHLIS